MARSFRYQQTPPFAPSGEREPTFAGLRPRSLSKATAVLEHTLKATDRLDTLAQHYYGDTRKWWRILDANPEISCGADLADPKLVGTIILIPAAEEPAGGS